MASYAHELDGKEYGSLGYDEGGDSEDEEMRSAFYKKLF
jgi:hypothetical protein